MSLVDRWLAGECSAQIDNPDFIGELRNRFWRAEAAEFAREQLGIDPDEELLAQLAEELREAELKLMEDEGCM